MSELKDLEAYEYVPTEVTNAREAAGRRAGRKNIVRLREVTETYQRVQRVQDRGRRQEPSMPKFKCLED